MKKPELLLHSCCGPCSSAVLERLHEDYDITLFYYNPNIFPKSEYDLRVKTQKQIIDSLPFGNEIKMVEGEWNPALFDEQVRGLENAPEGGDRCRICFIMRLNGAASYAKQNGFKLMTTTLSISPHKNSAMLNEVGEAAAKAAGISWLHSDFKKQNGFLRSIELSKQYGLYRQDYCGCKYSLRNRE